jgi:hypothetical protein
VLGRELYWTHTESYWKTNNYLDQIEVPSSLESDLVDMHCYDNFGRDQKEQETLEDSHWWSSSLSGTANV